MTRLASRPAGAWLGRLWCGLWHYSTWKRMAYGTHGERWLCRRCGRQWTLWRR
jgi:hypothetical protein